MNKVLRLFVAMAFLFPFALLQASDVLPNNRMAYHEVQGFEIKIGFFAGNSVDTYYLLITNTPDQFAAPQRLVLGVNKSRAIADLSKILEYMNKGHNFVYTDKTGTDYTFTRVRNSRRYVITWDGSDNGYCPIYTQTKSIERSIQWLTCTTTWNEAQELLVKLNDDYFLDYTFSYAPTIQIIDTPEID